MSAEKGEQDPARARSLTVPSASLPAREGPPCSRPLRRSSSLVGRLSRTCSPGLSGQGDVVRLVLSVTTFV